MPGILQSVVVIFSLSALLTAVVVQLFYLGARRCFIWLSPLRRARLLFLLSCAPFLVSLVLVVLVFVPSYMTLAGLVPDHCLVHDDHHGHLCFIHPPEFIRNPWVVSLSLLFILVFAWRLISTAGELYKGNALLQQFRRNSVRCPAEGYRSVDMDRVLACSIGFFRPEIFVSRRLEGELSTEELQAVIAHERAHVKRKDFIRLLLAKRLGVFFLPGVSAAIRADLALASEQVCDASAAAEVGSPLLVARTIVKVQKLLPEPAGGLAPVVLHFSQAPIVQRIELLLDRRRRGRFYHGVLPKYLLMISALVFVFVNYEPIHHYVENLYFDLFE